MESEHVSHMFPVVIHHSGHPSKRIFEVLGFTEEVMETDTTLRPPLTDNNSAIGKQNRRRLLRAWVEIGSWLIDFKKLNGK